MFQVRKASFEVLSLLLSVLNVGSLFPSLGAGVQVWRWPLPRAAQTVLAPPGAHLRRPRAHDPRPARAPHSPVCSRFRRLSSRGRQRLQPVGKRGARSVQNPAFHSLGQDGTGGQPWHTVSPQRPPPGAGLLRFTAGRGTWASVPRSHLLPHQACVPRSPHPCRPVSTGCPQGQGCEGL